jgi:hypothetical protein
MQKRDWIALNQQYLQSLDNLMGQLTPQGKHDAALAVRAEKRRVSAADAELIFGSDAHVIQWARSEVLRIGQAENSQRSTRCRFLVGVRKR